MPVIEVDGVSYEVREGVNLLHACLSQGLDLPYFCWHPSLGSVGACRQCAVVQYKDAADTRGKLTMACMTPATDGARLSVAAADAVRFRASVIEWLMLNHPHDCPVCEEGGECHLQDMTVMTGHTARRYRGRKRTFENQYLGPFIGHEMNRCITCYRCVRFYRDYAGGRDLDAFGSRDRLYFGRAEEGVLASEFAGNLVEVCPTGVFTDKTLSASYTRKWDLTSAPSLCHGCSLGCNTLPGERYGRLKRVHNRYHGDINGYFLCDRGRFGAGFVNAEQRLRHAGVRSADGAFDVVTAQAALEHAAELLGGGRRVAGIGSPRTSLEANFALLGLVGAADFCSGVSAHQADALDAVLAALGDPAIRVPTLREVERADAVLVLGEDVSNSAPRLALALRQATRNESVDLAVAAGIPAWQDAGVRGHAGVARSPLLQATVAQTRLDDVTTHSVHALPGDLTDIAEALAATLAGGTASAGSEQADRFVAAAAAALRAAERPLVVSGTGLGSAALVRAAGAVARALGESDRPAALLLTVGEANALGTRLLGPFTSLETILQRAAQGEIDTLVVLENELSRRADRQRLEHAFAGTDLIVLDCLENWTAEQAAVVLPAASFAESDGTWVNNEGRAQRHYRVFAAPEPIAPSWQWLARLGGAAGNARLAAYAHVDQVLAAIAAEHPNLAAVVHAGPGAHERPHGVPVPRQTHRFSGRTAMYADVTMHEPRTPADLESPLAFSMEGYRPADPGALLTYTWSPGWNSNQSIYKFQAEVGGALRGGPAGVRLDLVALGAAPPTDGNGARREADPGAAEPADGWLSVPLQDVFASDELSAHAGAMAARAPSPYAVLAPADAERLGIADGSGLRVSDGGAAVSVAARLDPAFAPGAVGLVEGLTGALCVVPGRRVSVAADPAYRPPHSEVIARG